MAPCKGHVGAVHAKCAGPTDLEVFYRPRDLILNVLKGLNADLIAMGSRGVSAWESANEVGLAGRFQCQRHRPPRALLSAARQA